LMERWGNGMLERLGKMGHYWVDGEMG
jgi:hypothetical protein